MRLVVRKKQNNTTYQKNNRHTTDPDNTRHQQSTSICCCSPTASLSCWHVPVDVSAVWYCARSSTNPPTQRPLPNWGSPGTPADPVCPFSSFCPLSKQQQHPRHFSHVVVCRRPEKLKATAMLTTKTRPPWMQRRLLTLLAAISSRQIAKTIHLFLLLLFDDCFYKTKEAIALLLCWWWTMVLPANVGYSSGFQACVERCRALWRARCDSWSVLGN